MKHFGVYDEKTGAGRWVCSIADNMDRPDHSQEGLAVIEVPEGFSVPFHVLDGTLISGDLPRPAEEAIADQWRAVRALRNSKMAETSWRVERAVEAGEQVPDEWKQYRQALRDITTQPDPFNIVWPKEPS